MDSTNQFLAELGRVMKCTHPDSPETEQLILDHQDKREFLELGETAREWARACRINPSNETRWHIALARFAARLAVAHFRLGLANSSAPLPEVTQLLVHHAKAGLDTPEADELLERYKGNEEFYKLAATARWLKSFWSAAPQPLNSIEIRARFESNYPGQPIFALPSESPLEMICEISRDQESSEADVFLRQSEEHYHTKLRETYILIEGRLCLHIDGSSRVLEKPGELAVITPGQKHWAEAVGPNPARLLVICTPPWTPEDHILVPKDSDG